ncbi:MAG: respiratory nitrate reductase subunit gamma [Methermicoccaceae archaeon]
MAMEYFSGVGSITMMVMSLIALGVFFIGLYGQFRKYGMGASVYGGPRKNSVLWFLSSILTMIFRRKLSILVKTFVLEVCLQTRILRYSPLRWVMHLMIFWGWMMLFLFSMLVGFFEMLNFGFDYIGLETPYYLTPIFWRDSILEIPNDFFGYVLLAGITIAILRRALQSSVRRLTESYDIVLIGALFIVTVTGFLAEWFRGGAYVLGDTFGTFASSAPSMALFHVILSFAFGIAIIPFTKYIHIITAPLVILATPTVEEARKNG